MKTVRSLMKRLQKLTEEDERWLDAGVAATEINPLGDPGSSLDLWAEDDFCLDAASKSWGPPTVWLVFSDSNLGDFM